MRHKYIIRRKLCIFSAPALAESAAAGKFQKVTKKFVLVQIRLTAFPPFEIKKKTGDKLA